MPDFIKGLELCESFFFDIAKPILSQYYPSLQYSAGLIGYGSDVLGYDDEISRDHMWGPRFYLFLTQKDITVKPKLLNTFSEALPYQYKGYSVNFTEPDPNDNGVRHAKLINKGKVNPLIFILTIDEFLIEQLGTANLSNLHPLDWLTFSEHRLLSLISGKMFVDGLDIMNRISPLKYYPKDVKAYLIASNWNIIASEQAFVMRCSQRGDENGSIIICARIIERLMRLCFLYKNTYAPYSKWFGTAFNALLIDSDTKNLINSVLYASSPDQREHSLVNAQARVADLHNSSGLTDYVDYKIESYFGRNIRVIFADRFAQAMSEKLKSTAFENIPLIGSFSQIGGLSDISDDKNCYERIRRLYE